MIYTKRLLSAISVSLGVGMEIGGYLNMVTNSKKIPNRTTVSLSNDALARLRVLMTYGDSYSIGIERLLDFYDKWKNYVPKEPVNVPTGELHNV